jgi:hypothetical protein
MGEWWSGNSIMSTQKDSIFRQKAIQKYRESREKTVLPRFVAPPVFFLFWILLILLYGAGLLVWFGQVPAYVTGSGVVLDTTSSLTSGNREAVALLFVPSTSSGHLRPGEPVQLQLVSTGVQITSAITAVEPQILSPSEVRKHYLLSITAPSLVVMVALGSQISGSVYAGSPVLAQIEVGSRPFLSLFPGFDTLLKNSY